jgi:hypothetical protein
MAKKLGKRAIVAVEPKHQVGQLVGFMLDSERIVGEVKEVIALDSIKVETFTGRRFTCTDDELKLAICTVSDCGGEATQLDGFCDECRKDHDEVPDFDEDEVVDLVERRRQRDHKVNFHGVVWNSDRTHFSIKDLNGIGFYGWWRKTREGDGSIVYSVDVFARREKKTVTMDSIGYRDKDPRDNMKSLNADISARCQVWMFRNFSDDAESFDAMKRKAEKPTLTIKNIGTIDRLIARLTEYRNVAIRHAGTRHVELRGDIDGEPTILVNINVAQQAIALDGKPPSLHLGSMVDQAIKTGGRGAIVRPSTASFTADKESVAMLVSQLAAAKAAGNDKEQRMIRATLRKLGVKGGLRAAKAAENGK